MIEIYSPEVEESVRYILGSIGGLCSEIESDVEPVVTRENSDVVVSVECKYSAIMNPDSKMYDALLCAKEFKVSNVDYEDRMRIVFVFHDADMEEL